MATQLVNKNDGVYEVKTTLSADLWKKFQDEALNKLCKKVQVKGFRKGMAPLEIAKDHISPDELINEAINLALPSMYNDVLKEHKLTPFTQPEVKVDSLENNTLTVTFEITVYPEVKLGKYKDLDVKLEKVSVNDEEVDHAITHLLEDNAELVLKDDTAQKGDTVVFDFKGYVNGKEFEGGSADNYSLVLGSNQFIPGFEDQLIGAKSESKVDVNVTFPEQYVKDLAGKEAKFVCMIHEIKTKKNPELTDDFAQSLKYNNVKTVSELKAYEKAELLKKKEQEARGVQFNTILDLITASSEIKVADAVVAKEANRLKENMIQQISQNGITLEQYKEITGTNDAQLDAQFKSQALNSLKQYVILNKVGEVENLKVNQSDVDSYFESMSQSYGMKVEDIKNYFTQQNQMNQIYENIAEMKIEKFLIANNAHEESKKEEKVSPAKEVKEEKTPVAKAKKSTTKKAVKVEK